jgi:hypothetical protein
VRRAREKATMDIDPCAAGGERRAGWRLRGATHLHSVIHKLLPDEGGEEGERFPLRVGVERAHVVRGGAAQQAHEVVELLAEAERGGALRSAAHRGSPQRLRPTLRACVAGLCVSARVVYAPR